MERPLDIERLLAEEAWILRLARGLVRGEAEARDLAQDVVSVALRKGPDVRGGELRAWLRTVARRLSISRHRQVAARARVERRAARSESVEDEAHARLERQRAVHEAVEELPAIYRTAIVLRYLEDLPPR